MIRMHLAAASAVVDVAAIIADLPYLGCEAISPLSLRCIFGRLHAEFATSRQQDAGTPAAAAAAAIATGAAAVTVADVPADCGAAIVKWLQQQPHFMAYRCCCCSYCCCSCCCRGVFVSPPFVGR